MTRSRLRTALALSVLPAALTAGLLTAPPASAAPAPGEIASSQNLRQVGFEPKSATFGTATNSDLAFSGDRAYQGNYDGFTVFDVSDPTDPVVLSEVRCPGSQNDISVYGDLLFLSTDSVRTNDSCQSASGGNAVTGWEGIKVFDVSDPRAPEYVASVATDCGSHTHTVVPSKDADPSVVYLYVSSYSPTGQTVNCLPPHDKISVVEVPLDAPEDARVVAEPVLFGTTGVPLVDGLVGGGATSTSGCHDITVFPAKDLAAGACMGDGVLLDISDRVAPKVVARVQDPNFAFWHSATFNRDATKVIFTDELGGGGSATCNPQTGPTRGADAIYTVGADRSLTFGSYFKIPRENTAQENCVAHNGSIIPVPGRDVFVQAWYQGGISVIDFTDPKDVTELAHWERGPIDSTRLVLGGSWSAYWYNGHIFSSDITKGLDVLRLTGDTSSANSVELDELNVQSQPVYP